MKVEINNINIIDENHIVVFGDLFVRFENTFNGYCYKNEDNFNKKEGVCYIPEYAIKEETGVIKIETNNDFYDYYKIADLYPNYYTYDDFIKLVDNDEKKASILFEMVDWQSPESLLYELDWSEIE